MAHIKLADPQKGWGHGTFHSSQQVRIEQLEPLAVLVLLDRANSVPLLIASPGWARLFYVQMFDIIANV